MDDWSNLGRPFSEAELPCRDQVMKRIAVSRCANRGHFNADRQRANLFEEKRLLPEVLPNPQRQVLHSRHTRVAQQHHEFIAAVSEQYIRMAEASADLLHNVSQDLVANRAPILKIHLFQDHDVDKQKGNGRACKLFAADSIDQMLKLFEGWQASECVQPGGAVVLDDALKGVSNLFSDGLDNPLVIVVETVHSL